VKQSITAIAITMVALGAPAVAQNAGDTSATKSTSPDAAFVREAATGGLAEVELGRLATQKAQSADVKQFGQRMVDDHSRANDQLKPIAQQKGVQVPTALTGKEKALYDRLSKLSGEAFDRAYMKAMVDDHKKDVDAFRHESTSGKDPDVKQFASQTLPTLEDHLRMAQTTAGAASTSGHTKPSTSGTAGSGAPAKPVTGQPANPGPGADK
jgi:putative membrane protein